MTSSKIDPATRDYLIYLDGSKYTWHCPDCRCNVFRKPDPEGRPALYQCNGCGARWMGNNVRNEHDKICGLDPDHSGGCRLVPLCCCNTCRNDVRSPLPGCLRWTEEELDVLAEAVRKKITEGK